MSLKKRMVLKGIVAVVLLLCAMAATVVIKELLSSRQPQSALPIIQVNYNDVPLPAEHIRRASYSWRFLTMVKEGGWEDESWLSPGDYVLIEPAPVLANTSLTIEFSYPPQQVIVRRATGNGNDFVEVGGDKLLTPDAAGVYTYQVQAWWGFRGSVQYYFRIDVR